MTFAAVAGACNGKKEADMVRGAPRVSIGMPVYNGKRFVREALDSILAQTYEDFEIIICDNASTDGTSDLCARYAQQDKRIRYVRNDENIGLIANFNKTFTLSRGEYFRWVGCDDWWSPEYIARCVEALDADRGAVLVTTYQAHYDDHGRRHYQEYTGPRVDSRAVQRRFRRMLWFFQVSRYYLDPIYSMMRRSSLMETGFLRRMLGTDLVLAAELSLIGRFCHVPECLASRRLAPDTPLNELARRCDPEQSSIRWWFAKLCLTMASIVLARPMSGALKARCLLSLAGYFVSRTMRRLYHRTRRLAGTVTGYRVLRAYLRDKSGDRRVTCRGTAERN